MTGRMYELGNTTMGLSWIERIDAATSTTEILDIARVYTASLTLDEISALPLECRPRKLVDASDLSEYAMDLMRASCDSPEPSPLVLKLAAVISHAATKSSEVLSVANDESGDTSTA
jgi:hypothetical protein